MAISLNKSLETGVVVSYLRISRIVVDRKSEQVSFSIEAYLDQESRQSGKKAVTDYQYTLDDKNSYNIINNMDIITSIYTVLKTLPDFEGASDV